MAKYSLDTLTSIFLPKNVRKTRDNLYESRVTLVPHADAISLYHVVKDIIEYLNITPGSGTTDLTSTPSSTNVVIASSSGNDATIAAATTSLAGVMTASDKVNLNSLVTLSGVSAGSTTLGTFTGTTIPDSSTIKQALQALETSLEASVNYTDEKAQDAVGNILVDSSTIQFTYGDPTPSISADVIDSSITYAKIQNVTAQRLLGRGSSSSGVVQELTVGSGLTLSSSSLDHADTSSISDSSNSGATVIQSLTFDTYGHVRTLSTKTLTAADLGGINGSGGANRVAYWLDGDTLTSDSDFTFNGSGLAINTALATGFTLHSGGATKSKTILIEGSGTLGSALTTSEIRLNNTSGSVWYLHSANNSDFIIGTNSLDPELTLDSNGDVLVENKLYVGDTTSTAVSIIGQDSSGYLAELTIGSGLSISGGEISATGGGLVAGTSLGQILYWDGTDWAVATPKKDIQLVSSGSQVTLPFTPITGLHVDVYLNGLLQESTVDYTIASNIITFAFSFTTNDKITTKYYA